MRGLVDAFCAKGYALRGGVRDLGPGSGGQGTESREVVVKLEGPAQLWGARQLSARGVVPINEYLGMAATGFCRASGVRSSYRASYTDVAAELSGACDDAAAAVLRQEFTSSAERASERSVSDEHVLSGLGGYDAGSNLIDDDVVGAAVERAYIRGGGWKPDE